MTSQAFAEPEDIVDFSGQVTPTCKVVGLTATPPPGWFNVPIDSEDKAISGCQMMRVGEQDELEGIIRLLSAQVEEAAESPPWYAVMIALEQQTISEMGYALGEVLWSRTDVPITGEGFGNARAVGLTASIEGNDIPQEAHFLVFEHGPQKFIITLLTPAQEVDDSVFYKRNTEDFGVLIRSLSP
jgi:hypothetical protein